MKTIKQQNMDLDLRRFGHNLYTEALNSGSGEGSGLSDNLIDNWVNLVTQGEYTKYKDVPEGHTVKVGVMEGWSRPPEDNGLIVERTPSTISANLFNIVDGQEQVVLFKNVFWKINSSHIIA